MMSMPQKKNRPVIIAVGLYIPGVGFTRVFESLFARLSEYYNIHWLGIAYKGPVIEKEHYTLYPNNLTGGDMYGAYAAAGMATELKASCIWLLNDLYMMQNYSHVLASLKKKGVKLVAYVPLDGEIKDEKIIEQVLFLDKMVLYNQWAQDEVSNAIKRLSEKEKITHSPQLSNIYHGVDTDIFTAIPKNKAGTLREAIFPVPHAADTIFILNANRYNERKDIDSTLRAFAMALPSFEKKTYLCLHMPMIDPLLRIKLMARIGELKLNDNIIFNPLGDEYLSNEELCNLYRACNIGVNTSVGEGWGLISFEHAASGAAQIVPGHTAGAEVWKNTAALISKQQPVQLSTNPFLMYHVNENELVEQLIVLVNDSVQRNQLSERCHSHALQKKFSWNEIAVKWIKLLQ